MMNKRLRQFEKESGIELYSLGKDREKWEDTLSKFAELIVRECLLYTKEGDIDFMKFMIKKNFGVNGD